MTSLRLLPLVLVLGPAALPAQETLDSRWLPWLGCWQVGEVAAPGAPLVCVRPSDHPLGVEVASLAGGRIEFSRTLVADALEHDLALEDCAGSQAGRFAADGRRVFLRSTLTCAGGRRRTASAIMGITPDGTWLDAQSLSMADEQVPRVLHYHPAPLERWPGEFRLSPERSEALAEARVLAGSRLSLLDVREAASQADPDAVATFLVELNQAFDLTGENLAALDDAGVPGPVIDAVVAVSFPERFAVVRAEVQPAYGEGPPPAETYRDPYGWGWWSHGLCGYDYHCGAYGFYSYDLGLRGYWPFGYDPAFFGGYWGRTFIVPRGELADGTPGAAINGRGYTRGGVPTDGEGRFARPRDRSTSADAGATLPSASERPATSGGSSASPAGYSRGGESSSGSSSGAAKPKHD